MHCDRIWRDARLATMAPALPGLGIIERGLIAVREGRIVYAGPEDAAASLQAEEVVACEGRWITPGLIDCHTHLVHGETEPTNSRLGSPGPAMSRLPGRVAGFSPPCGPPGPPAGANW